MKWRLVALACISTLVVVQFLPISFTAYPAVWNKIKALEERNGTRFLLHPKSYEIPANNSEQKIYRPTRKTGSKIVEISSTKNGKFGIGNTRTPKTNITVTEQSKSTQDTDVDIRSPLRIIGNVYPTLDDCLRIIQDEQNGRNITDVAVPDVTEDEEVVRILQQGCDDFMKRYDFMSKEEQILYSTVEELDFAIGYTILAHKNLHQIATLLSSIYRNQNIYCIHADLKSPDSFLNGVRLIAKCFHNVFEATKRERVVYASFSRLKAEVNCMKDLLALPASIYDWKYLVNLCGQDFPVSTNLEIVKQLKSMNGKNCFAGTSELNDIAVRRVKFVHELKNVTVGNQTKEMIYQTKRLLEPPPYNLTTVKNMAYAIFTREFLQWALVDSKEGAALFNWSSYTKTPDEHFWGTLHVYPKSPGSSKSISWRDIARATLWKSPGAEEKCRGYWQHNFCVFGGGSMWWLMKVQQLFVNKFDISYDATPIRCLRMLLDERTRGNASDLNPNKKPMAL